MVFEECQYSVTLLLYHLGLGHSGGQLFEDQDCHGDHIVYICHTSGSTHLFFQHRPGVQMRQAAFFSLHCVVKGTASVKPYGYPVARSYGAAKLGFESGLDRFGGFLLSRLLVLSTVDWLQSKEALGGGRGGRVAAAQSQCENELLNSDGETTIVLL